MAVQDEDSFKRYVANGVATVYAIPFLLLSASDLQVTLDAVPVTSGFTVSGVGSNTGSITFDAAPTGDLLLQRVVPFQRLTDYQDNGDLLAQTVNRDFDRLWLAMQELRRNDITALRTSSLEPEGIPNLPLAAQRASRVLAFGPTGDPVVSSLTLDELEQQPALAIAAADAAVAAAGASSASASASASSALAAAEAEEKAQKWADEAEDVPVEPGLYSARHWAIKAALSLTSAIPSPTTINSLTDFNSVTTAGWHSQLLGGAAGSRNPNHPDGQTAIVAGNGVVNYYWLLVARYFGNLIQVALPYLSGADSSIASIKFRMLGGGVWSPWRSLLHSANSPFSREYTSGEQTITTGGALNLTHGLGAQPKTVQAKLVCKTADLGYSVGDEVLISHDSMAGAASTYGMSLVADATALSIKYCATANVFGLIHKSTGTAGTITASSWRLVVRAWA